MLPSWKFKYHLKRPFIGDRYLTYKIFDSIHEIAIYAFIQLQNNIKIAEASFRHLKYFSSYGSK